MRKLEKDPMWLEYMRKANKNRMKPVITNKGEKFESVSEAARQTGGTRSNIRACINGKIKTCVGRTWKYLN